MLSLDRLCSSSLGTRGVFLIGKKVLCHSFELPWYGNVKDKSCIPTGEYTVSKETHPTKGLVFRLMSVPSRKGILIHVGNTLADTTGCILPGLDVSDYGVLFSDKAMKRLWAELPYMFNFVVREV